METAKNPKVVKLDGKDYIFELTSASHRRIKAMTDVSLPDCVHDVSGAKTQEERESGLAQFNKVISDFDLLPRIVYAMLLPELQKNGLDEEKFHALFDGPTYTNCGFAVTQALIDFFQNDRQGRGKLLEMSVKMAMRAMEVQEKWSQKAAKVMTKKMDRISENLDSDKAEEAVESMIQKTLTTSSTTSQESLASILDLSR